MEVKMNIFSPSFVDIETYYDGEIDSSKKKINGQGRRARIDKKHAGPNHVARANVQEDKAKECNRRHCKNELNMIYFFKFLFSC